MTIYTVKAPDGKTLEINGPPGASAADVLAQAQQLYQPVAEEDKPMGGFFSSFLDELKQQPKIGVLATKWATSPTDENRQKLIDAGDSKYQQVGFGQGHNWAAFRQMLGGSFGQQMAPLAAGAAAAIPASLIAAGETAGTEAVEPLGGGLVGAAVGLTGIGKAETAGYMGADTAQYTAQALQRQAQEQADAQGRGEAVPGPQVGRAAAAGAAEARLDLLHGEVFAPLFKALPFVKNLVAPVAEKAVTDTAEKIAEAASKGTFKTVAGGVARGVAGGVAFEVPQEVAQQALERWQAGLSLTNADAQEEYKQAAIGSALMGGVLGAPSGAIKAVGHRNAARDALAPEQPVLSTPATAQAPVIPTDAGKRYAAEVAKVREANPQLPEEQVLIQAGAAVASPKPQEAIDVAGTADSGGPEPGIQGDDGGRGPVQPPADITQSGATGVEPVGPVAGPSDEREGLQQPALTRRQATKAQVQQAADNINSVAAANTNVPPVTQKHIEQATTLAMNKPDLHPVEALATVVTGAKKPLGYTPPAAVAPVQAQALPSDMSKFQQAISPAPSENTVWSGLQQNASVAALNPATYETVNTSPDTQTPEYTAIPQLPESSKIETPPVQPPLRQAWPVSASALEKYDAATVAAAARGEQAQASRAKQDAKERTTYLATLKKTLNLLTPAEIMQGYLRDGENKVEATPEVVAAHVDKLDAQVADAMVKHIAIKADPRVGPNRDEPMPASITGAKDVYYEDYLAQLTQQVKEADRLKNQVIRRGRNYDRAQEKMPKARPTVIVSTKAGDSIFYDTRGEGVQYHGARAPVEGLSEGYYNENNIYGGADTLYTTDAVDIASGYGRKNPNATVHAVQERARVKWFDMEDPRSQEEWDAEFNIGPEDDGLLAMAVEDAVQEHNGASNLRQIMDAMRDMSRSEGLSKFDVQEDFDRIIQHLRGQGYTGMQHVGGLNTKRPAHIVKIYFAPHEQVGLTSIDLKKFRPPVPVSVHTDLTITKTVNPAGSPRLVTLSDGSNVELHTDTSAGKNKPTYHVVDPQGAQAPMHVGVTLKEAKANLPGRVAAGRQGFSSQAPEGWGGVEAEPAPMLHLLEQMGDMPPSHAEQVQRLWSNLRNELNRLGLKDVNLRVLNDAEKAARNWAQTGTTGKYYPSLSLIDVALRSPVGTFDHEVFHAIEDLGVLSPKELRLIDAEIARYPKLVADVERRYSGTTEAVRLNERRAVFFQSWLKEEALNLSRGAQTALEKVKKFIEALHNWMQGNGFHTVEDVFNAIISGEVGHRERGLSTLANLKPFEARSASVEDLQRALTASRTAQSLNRASAALAFKTRNLKDFTHLVDAQWKSLSIDALRKAIGFMTTNDISRWVGDRIQNIVPLNNLINEMGYRRMDYLREVHEKIHKLDQYFNRSPKGGEALADLMHASTLEGIDPTTAPDAAAYIKAEKAQGRRPGKERTAKIELVYGLWDKLRTQGINKKTGNPAGHDLYRMVKDDYQKDLDRWLTLMDDQLTASGMSPEAKKNTLAELTKNFVTAVDPKTGQPRHLRNVYFPLFRDGMFWFNVGKSPDNNFQMFRDATSRNYALTKEVEKMNRGGDARTLDQMLSDGDITHGDNVQPNHTYMANSSDMLKRVFAEIDKGGATNPTELKDAVVQMYLATLPEQDVRKKFMERKGTEGFTADVRQAYTRVRTTTANQLARLEYAEPIRNTLGQAYGELAGNPDKLKLSTFVDEMAKRAAAELSPRDDGWLGKLASLGNKVTFFWMLTGPKTALTQMTQLPIVGFPTLIAEYGLGATSKVAAKHLNFFNKWSTTRLDQDGEVVTDWGQPSIVNSDYVTKGGELGKALGVALREAERRGLLSNTYAADLAARGRAPSVDYSGAPSRASRAVFNFFTGGFHHMERMSRNVMFASAFELEFNKLRKSGVSADEATTRGIEKAQKMTNEALFDYAQSNKPRQFKTPLGRTAFQFLTYPLQMSSFLVRNGVNMMRHLPENERKAAATKFFGTLGMTALFAGATGMPMYGLMMGLMDTAVEGWRKLFGEDAAGDDSDPLQSRSMDLWFRRQFIPSMFGSGALGRSVEMGPISALSDMNIGASTSLDNMWFNGGNTADDAQSAMGAFVLEHLLGPTGSLASNFGAAYDDYQNGYGERALEKILPAFARNIVVEQRLAGEGAQTKDGAMIKDAEWYTTGKLLGQSLGFASTEVNEIQKANNTAKQIVMHITTERSVILKHLGQAMQRDADNPTPHTRAQVEAVLAAVQNFNEANSFYPITAATIRGSITGREKSRTQAIQGLVVDKPFVPFAAQMNAQ